MFVLVVWLFVQPNHTAAARRVSVAPPEDRVTQLRGDSVSEYMSGVATMVEAINEQAGEYAEVRLLALGVLFWLACSPAFRRVPHTPTAETHPHAGTGSDSGA